MLWLRGRRPRRPPTWRADVKAAAARAAQWAAGKLTLLPGEDAFDETIWKAHKVTFSRRQHGKCGYCEMSIAADPNGGDVEHYRPKAEVTRLLAAGEEIDGHNSRDPRQRRQAPRISDGYWWLAYDWRNYLLACGTCNQKWKGSLFPRQGNPTTAPTRAAVATEVPLLLNPYGAIDPAAHLAFDKVGLVTPRSNSDHGRETIRTCHLARESLRRSRKEVAEVAWPRITRVLKELGRTPRRDRPLRAALGDMLRMGTATHQHAGMVRAMWAQRDPYNLSWKQLRALRDALRAGP